MSLHRGGGRGANYTRHRFSRAVHMEFGWINNKQINTPVSRSNFFKTRNLQEFKDHVLHSDFIKIHFRRLFLCVAETHSIFLLCHMFLWCSFTNNAWSHGINERNQIIAAQKRYEYWFNFEGPSCNYQWRHHISRNVYLPDCLLNKLFRLSLHFSFNFLHK